MYIHVHIHVLAYTYMHACMHTHIHTYIQTDRHAYIYAYIQMRFTSRATLNSRQLPHIDGEATDAQVRDAAKAANMDYVFSGAVRHGVRMTMRGPQAPVNMRISHSVSKAQFKGMICRVFMFMWPFWALTMSADLASSLLFV